jgi:hypothetical protein
MGIEAEKLSASISNLKIQEDDSPCIIICDAWYGFPKEGRPRKERILAVSKQIYNFSSWRSNYMKDTIKKKGCQVVVIGEAKDIESIKERVEELERKMVDLNMTKNAVGGKDAKGTTNIEQVSFLPGETLEELASELSNETLESINESNAVISYLSPDADEKLNASMIPPRIVVVGMLVDRKVQPNRSKLRAESLIPQDHKDDSEGTLDSTMIQPVQLPLDALNVKDLSEDEPLNIDTVMEMMQRWWLNSHSHSIAHTEPSALQRKKYFVDAAARSLLTHRQRHPNRVIHGGVSSGS